MQMYTYRISFQTDIRHALIFLQKYFLFLFNPN